MLVMRAESGAVAEQDILTDNLVYMKKRVDETGELLKRMMSEQDAFEIHLTEKQSLEGEWRVSNFIRVQLPSPSKLWFKIVNFNKNRAFDFCSSTSGSE